jgi:hypothetical protein
MEHLVEIGSPGTTEREKLSARRGSRRDAKIDYDRKTATVKFDPEKVTPPH